MLKKKMNCVHMISLDSASNADESKPHHANSNRGHFKNIRVVNVVQTAQ